jgi:DNA-binding IclR family transcriptional regulator
MDWLGHRMPLHTTSAGKVFLAHLPAAELKAKMARGLKRFTEHTIVDPKVLEQQLAVVREVGYARAVDEHEIGLSAVAAPIRSLDGQVIATLTIAGPTFRLYDSAIPVIAEHLMSAAAEISERNGYPRPG